MEIIIANLGRLLRGCLQPADTLSIKQISRENMPYFISWISGFIWIYAYFLPFGGFKFESGLYNNNVGSSWIYYLVWLLVVCTLPLLFDGRWFVPKTFYSVIVAFACFVLIRYTGASILSKGLMLTASACLGHIFASNVYTFFIVLNNSEKFYSMIFAVLLPKVLMFTKPVLNDVYSVFDFGSLIILTVIIILAVCLFFFRRNIDAMPSFIKTKAPAKAYLLMPLGFVVFSLNEVIAPASLHQILNISKREIESFYFLGIIIGIIGVILLQRILLVNLCNMLNISFALLTIGFVMNIISLQNSTAGLISAVCFGNSYTVGLINIYYFTGFMTKKFRSISFYRAGIVSLTINYILAIIIIKVFEDSVILAPPTFMALISICIVILFFILSPYFTKLLFSGEWIDDTYRQDVTKCSRLEARLVDYKLTPAEIEVCRLLLDGCTLRQIAGIQSKAYATINTYCTSIYRKMNINSRAELLLILQDYVPK